MHQHTIHATAIVRYLQKRGAWVARIRGTWGQRKGLPDILACWQGRLIAIEVKTGKGRLTPQRGANTKPCVQQVQWSSWVTLCRWCKNWNALPKNHRHDLRCEALAQGLRGLLCSAMFCYAVQQRV